MVTLREIAKVVGVSSTTVSRVLNYDATLSISEAKRKAIIETAEALNYLTPRNRPRAAAPAPASDALRVVLVHFLRPAEELVDPYYIGVRFGIESRCRALSAEVVNVYHSDSLPDPALLLGASGVIAIGKLTDAEIDWLDVHSRNLVFADVCPAVELFDGVESDLRYAMVRMLDALHGAGYRRIGFIGGTAGQDNVRYPLIEKRAAGYCEWMQARGLFDPRLLMHGVWCFETGYELTRRLLALDPPPDMVIAGNDNVAIGAYRAIMEHGLSIPGDIGVASFNDIPAAQFLAPPLTTVKIQAERIGETAVDLLMERLAGRDYVKRVSIATEMVWRNSCRLPPAP